MPVSFRDLMAGEATVAVTYNGHPVNLTYDPSRVTESALREVVREIRDAMRLVLKTSASTASAPTPVGSTGDAALDANLAKLDALMVQIDDMEQSSAIINTLLVRFLVRWDVLDDDGVHMFPITPERLPDLPLAFRQLCVSSLFSEQRMGEAKGTPSRRRSRRRS